MRAWPVAASAILLTAFAPAPAPAEDVVRKLALGLADALAQGDAGRVAAVLGPGFVAVDTRGGLRSAPEFLSDVRAAPRNAALPKLARE